MELDELDKKFTELLKQFPQAKRGLVEDVGEKLYEKVISNIDSTVSKHSGKLKDGVKKHIGSKGGYAAVRADYKIAPHTHLIENGHKIVRDGKIVGWVSGKHMYRNALNEMIDEIQQDAEKMLSGLVGDVFD